MGKSKPPRVDVPDPREIIRAEMEANRYNTSGPFGSTTWQGNTQVTELSPEMQAIQSQMMGLAGQSPQQVEVPDFLKDIAGGMMSNVGQRYGVGSKPNQGQPQPSPMPVGPTPGGFVEPSNLNISRSPAFTPAPSADARMAQIRELLAQRQNMEQR